MDGKGVSRVPADGEIRQLLDWRPELGVVSVYVAIDPGDRGEPWRVALREGLERIVEAEADKHHRGPALAATVQRIEDSFQLEIGIGGRCKVGFCEVAPKEGREIWLTTQIHRDETQVVDRDRPYVTPLLELIEHGSPVGVAAVSAERVRLYEWALGDLSELEDWEAVLFMPDWRERKAQSSPDPARIQGPSASGHDQFNQRLDANRERFLEQVGGLVAERADGRSWRRVLAFGEPHLVDRLRDGTSNRIEVELAEPVDLISENDHGRLLERIDAAVQAVNRSRELELVKTAVDSALAPAGRGAVGIHDIETSLQEGRVRHLLFDAGTRQRDVLETKDRLVEQALRTSAEVTPVQGEAAEVLRGHGGVAALLRY
jgi:hypothetical protein